MAPYSTLSIEFNDLGTAVITFHRADDTINRIDPIFVSDFTNAIAELSKTKPKGIILRAKQGVFLAGADLNLFLTTNANMQPKLNHLIDSFKRTLRLLETLGCPAVACLSGAALGGGWEMALACHHRIAISPHTQVGLPEVTLGLLPGAGGITRTIRLFGLEDSIPMLCLGTVIDAHQALEKNWLQAIVDTPEQAIEHAQQWIEQNPTAQQPWSMKCASPKPSMDKTFIEQWRKKLNRQEGGRDPAPVRILEIALKSVELSFTESERLEAEALADLAHGPVSQHKIMLWRQQQQLIKGEQRPEAPRSAPVNTLGVIGAGMMGRGICETAAIHNINVKLMDKDETTAAKAKTAIGQGIQRNCSTLSPDKQALIMGRIKPSNHLDDCQLIIEAVYEDEALKSQVIQSIPNPTHPCYIASNTSTLPISKLSQSCYDPSQFLGLHFFSPVSKMPLVEIICGQHTSNETLAYGWDFVRQLQKVPMVVKDGCGFFTTRLFASYTAEGLAMIEQGYSAHDIERAAFQQGFPMGPLAIIDEVSIPLMQSIHQSISNAYSNQKRAPLLGEAVLADLIDLGHMGRLVNAGFYTYEPTKPKKLFEALHNTYPITQTTPDLTTLSDRLWMIQAIEALRCIEQGVIDHMGAANVGSTLGIGFPKWMGGVIQAINYTGLNTFEKKSLQLAKNLGKRFDIPAAFKQFIQSHDKINVGNFEKLCETVSSNKEDPKQ